MGSDMPLAYYFGHLTPSDNPALYRCVVLCVGVGVWIVIGVVWCIMVCYSCIDFVSWCVTHVSCHIHQVHITHMPTSPLNHTRRSPAQ